LCNSYALPVGESDWAEYFEARYPKEFEPKYSDSFPGNDVVSVREIDGDQVAEVRRWGLVPVWAKLDALPDFTKGAKNRNNARGETIYSNGIFRHAAGKGQRCLLPATAFYEFTGPKGGKTKHVFTIKDQALFSFAGLYEAWLHPDDEGQNIYSCTLVTCDPSEEFKEYHHREPVIIPQGLEEMWLNPETPQDELYDAIIKPTSFNHS